MADFSFLKELFAETGRTYLDVENRMRRYEREGNYIEIIALWCEGIQKRLKRKRCGEIKKTDITRFRIELDKCLSKAIEQYQNFPVEMDRRGALKDLKTKKKLLAKYEQVFQCHEIDAPLLTTLLTKLDILIDRYASLIDGISAYRSGKLTTAIQQLETVKSIFPEAEDYLTRAEQDEKESFSHFLEAEKLLRENKTDQSRIEFEKGRQKNRESEYVDRIPRMLKNREQALDKLTEAKKYVHSDIDRSFICLTEALQIDSYCDVDNFREKIKEKYLEDRFTRGLAHQNKKEIEPALDQYRQILELDEDYQNGDVKRRVSELEKVCQQLKAIEAEVLKFLKDGDPEQANKLKQKYHNYDFRIERLDLLFAEVGEAVAAGRKLYNDGKQLLEQKHYEKALSKFQKLKEKYPRWKNVDAMIEKAALNAEAKALFASANECQSKKQLREALNKLNAIDPKADNYTHVREKREELEKQIKLAEKNYDDARQFLEKAQFDLAQKHIQKALDILPAEEAFQQLNKEIEIQVRAKSSFEQAKQLFEKQGKLDDALKLIKTAVENWPGEREYLDYWQKLKKEGQQCEQLYQTARQSAEQGNLEAAIADLEKLNEKGVQYKDSVELLAQKKANLERVSKQLFPQAQAHFQNNQLAECRRVLNKILELYPRYDNALKLEQDVVRKLKTENAFKQINELRSRGDYRAALAEANRLQSLDPESPSVAEVLAQIEDEYIAKELAQIAAHEKNKSLATALNLLKELEGYFPSNEQIKHKMEQINASRKSALQQFNFARKAVSENSFTKA